MWYDLSDTYEASMSMLGFHGKDWQSGTGFLDWYDYRLRTPWKFNVSAAYTFGQDVAVNAEYEYADYSSAKFSDIDGYDLEFSNQTVKEDLKGVSSFRVGLETRLLESLSLRFGYNYTSALYDKNAYKYDAPQSTQTDVEFMNNFDSHNASVGLGFRLGGFYADVAYVYTHQKAEFHPYSNLILGEADSLSKVTNVNNRAVLTLGYRF